MMEMWKTPVENPEAVNWLRIMVKLLIILNCLLLLVMMYFEIVGKVTRDDVEGRIRHADSTYDATLRRHQHDARIFVSDTNR